MIRRAAMIVLAVSTALVLATACGSEGTETDCGINGCTITFPRDGGASVSVLGVDARLVGVQDGRAEIEVAGHTVTVPVGGEANAEGFTIGVEQATDTEVVVRVQVA